MKKTKYLVVFSALFFFSLAILRVGDAWEIFRANAESIKSEPGDLKFNRLSKTLFHIQEQYVDPDRISPKEMFKKTLEYFSLGIAEVLVQYPTGQSAILTVRDSKKEFDLNLRNVFALQSAIVDAAKFVLQNKSSDIRQDEIETFAVNAVLATLDPHSQYLSKENYEETKVGTSGQFGGLGIVIGIRDSILTVISPLDGTPAFRAGLKPGDQITKIGSEPTESMLLEEAVQKMRGRKGTSVALTVMRKGWTEGKEYKITRDTINIVSVESELLKNRFGYAKVKTFQEDTTTSLEKHLQKLAARAGGKLQGLIIDLRNNPGGLLDQAIGVSDLFLEKGVIVSTVGPRKKVLEKDDARESGTEPNYPIIILTNMGSASASEIVAGSLKENKRAITLGEQTFGKGTVQQLFSLPPDAALKLTIAKYLNAGSVSIQNTGIVPEVQTLAAVVKKDFGDLFENEDIFREERLEGHFSSQAKEKQEKPDVSIRYLANTEGEEADPSATILSSLDSPQKREEKLLKNFDIQFATRILEGTKGANPKDLIDSAEKLSAKIASEEAAKVRAALLQQGIDWSEGPEASKSCAAPSIQWSLWSNQKAISTAKAGEKIALQVEVKNPSACTFYQLKAISKSKTYIFSDHEFLFGKVGPGQKVARSIKIELPKSTPSGLIPVEFNVSDQKRLKDLHARGEIAVESIASPDFGFSYSTTAAAHPGKSFDISFYIKNIGKQATEKATIALKPEEGSFVDIRRNRMPIATLKPGEERAYSFTVAIPPSFSGESVYLNLEMTDYTYRSYLTKKVTIPLREAALAKTAFYTPPSVQVVDEKALLKSRNDRYFKVSGSVKDDYPIKDLYILVNQKKVYYKQFNAKNVSEILPFETELPLDDGENQVSIVARDQSDLFGRKNYILYRTKD